MIDETSDRTFRMDTVAWWTWLVAFIVFVPVLCVLTWMQMGEWGWAWYLRLPALVAASPVVALFAAASAMAAMLHVVMAMVVWWLITDPLRSLFGHRQ